MVRNDSFFVALDPRALNVQVMPRAFHADQRSEVVRHGAANDRYARPLAWFGGLAFCRVFWTILPAHGFFAGLVGGAFGLCGAGGVASMRRSTSSSDGGFWIGSCFFIGELL